MPYNHAKWISSFHANQQSRGPPRVYTQPTSIPNLHKQHHTFIRGFPTMLRGAESTRQVRTLLQFQFDRRQKQQWRLGRHKAETSSQEEYVTRHGVTKTLQLKKCKPLEVTKSPIITVIEVSQRKDTRFTKWLLQHWGITRMPSHTFVKILPMPIIRAGAFSVGDRMQIAL